MSLGPMLACGSPSTASTGICCPADYMGALLTLLQVKFQSAAVHALEVL